MYNKPFFKCIISTSLNNDGIEIGKGGRAITQQFNKLLFFNNKIKKKRKKSDDYHSILIL